MYEQPIFKGEVKRDTKTRVGKPLWGRSSRDDGITHTNNKANSFKKGRI